MLYRRVALWFLPLFILLILATMMLFMQISNHAHAAAPARQHTVTAPATTPTVQPGGMTPDWSWRG